MKLPFSHILAQYSNIYVVHQIKRTNNILDIMHENSIVFFDDCLYSQYIFLTQNIVQLKQKNIYCVISFSTNIYRHNGLPIEYADCAICHERFHAGDMTVLQCYMSIDEIKELLHNDNIYLACHGNKHLQLKNIKDKNIQSKLFIDDINEAVDALKKLNLKTNIFVFPYAYSNFPLSYSVLNRNKFYYIFAGKDSMRIQIEG